MERQQNLKVLLTQFTNSQNNISNLYNPQNGYIYCLINEMYKFYGDNVTKCGNSIEPANRMTQYTTSYLKPCELVITSKLLIDKNLGETLLFFFLKKYRMENNREFFDCNINLVKEAFCKVEQFFDKCDTKEKIISYLMQNDNYKFIYNVKEINFEKLKKDEINIYYKMIHNNNITLLSIENITKIKEHLKNRKLFLDDIKDLSLCESILCNEDQFKKYIEKKLLTLNFDNFCVKSLIIKNNQLSFINNYNELVEKINIFFWIESILNINRFDIQNIKLLNLSSVKDIFIKNVDKLKIFYNKSNSKSIAENINNISNVIQLQKLIKEYYKEFNENITIIQKKEKRITSDDEMRDIIIFWFKDNYKYTEKKTDICKMRDLYDDFSTSTYYVNLTKNEKRKYNKSYFSDYFSTNPFLGKYHKETYNNIKNCVVGWTKIFDNELEDDLSN